MLLEINNQISAMLVALLCITNRIELKTDILQSKVIPKTLAHHDQFGINIGTSKTQRFRTNLMKLAIAPTLRTLMPEHRTCVPKPLGAIVGQIMFESSTHHTSSTFRTQCQIISIHRIDE